jgi:hypothetical protein
MPTIADPVSLVRKVATGVQRCFNRVQLEDAAGTPVSAASPLPVVDTWEIVTISRETLVTNVEVIPVPAGFEWQVLWIWVEYIADVTANARQLEIQLRDAADDVIGGVRVGTTQPTNSTRYYMIAPAMADLTAFRDTDYLMTPLPPTVFLPAGYDIRIFDNNNISANDGMIVQMQVARRAP